MVNIKSDFSSSFKDWKMVFVITLWWLWKQRNELIFSNTSKSVVSKVLWIRTQVIEIENAFAKPPFKLKLLAYLLLICWVGSLLLVDR